MTMRPEVQTWLNAIEDESRRTDCESLLVLMQDATECAPALSGSIVGFGRYHYRYDSGHEGETFLAGLASRRSDLTLYLYPQFPEKPELLKRLGRHKAGKGCIYLRRLQDVDHAVLRELITASVSEIRRQHRVVE
jgi:hypothetical protein